MSDTSNRKSRRLDIELVQRGLFSSRAQAQAAIEAGKVIVDGAVASKPGIAVGPDVVIEAQPAHPWVSRGGVKLAHALDAFAVFPQGRACLDVGASTGGFVDVLLSRGARRVVAVDVGRDQLHPKLRADSRVISLEGTDARELTAELLGESPMLVVCDASFIGLAKVLGKALSLAGPGADLVALFKPQFEVGPAHVGKGGLVSDATATDAAANTVEDWLRSQGWVLIAWTPSPIAGGDGNQERLLHARRS